ncbi:MAG TPA: DUF3048 domain-containing protein [Verrucomicrobiae bacterium]|nr:DUF3048 domain-containing protein [Verrucomicrobiae bacterium]
MQQKQILALWQKLKTQTHRLLGDHTTVRYFFLALGGIVAVGVLLLVLVNQPLPESHTGYSYQPPPEKRHYSPLTGLEVKDEAATKQAATAIMIENSPDARPQSGLKESGVVFEAIAEGGITRFQVIYQQEKPQLIGPVRSLRPYYLAWAAPFDASIAHVGGSFLSLQEVRGGGYRDIDQFFNDGAYWRAADREAPHNVYTSFRHLDALNRAKKYTTSKVQGFLRQEIPKTGATPAPTQGKKATAIQVNISSPTYNSSYTYDARAKNYPRSQGGQPHLDREKGRIAPKVVVVMKVKMSLGFEDGWREQIQFIGSGEAYIFQEGKVVEGTWRKNHKRQQIQFLTKAGQPIPLVRGQTWVTALPSDRSVTWQ